MEPRWNACGSCLVLALLAAGCGSSGAGKASGGGANEGGAAGGDSGAIADAIADAADAGVVAVPPGSDAGSPVDSSVSGQGDGSVPTDAALIGDAGGTRRYILSNQCTQTVWVTAIPATTFPGGVVQMAPGSSFQVAVNDGWSGRIWGKVRCVTSGGKLTCPGDPFPSTLAEFTLTKTPDAGGLDFYDISLVDGFNLPLEIVAIGHTPDPQRPYSCGDPSCAQDLNATCPQPLQDQVAGKTIACANDECKVLGGNDASSPDCIYPNQYTRFFKTACPTSYSYPYDDPTSTFTCKGSNDYAIVFCP